MYSPIVAMDVAAANATELPRLGSPRMKLRVHASQTTEILSEPPNQVAKKQRNWAHLFGLVISTVG